MEQASRWISLSLCYCLTVLHIALSFNLDTSVPIVKIGNKDSYFGFSVAQHVIEEEKQVGNQVVTELHNVFLVGAPRDNVTVPSSPAEVRQISRPGAVHRCPFTSLQDDCDQLELMLTAPLTNFRGLPEEDRTDQWLGVTVASPATPGGKAMACAHRHKRKVYNGNDISAIWGPGVCVSILNELDQDNIFDVCGSMSTDRGHQDYGFCQAGISASANADNDIFVGAAGAYTWRGMVAKNKFYTFGGDQKLFLSKHLDYAPPDQPIMPDTEYFSYLGMSTAIGHLLDNQVTYVAGAPRSNETGQVILYLQGEEYLERTVVLTGDQFGSYFGNALAILDINGDGIQDLVVGSPYYFEDGVGGAIYVYISGPQGITTNTKATKIPSRKMPQTECKELDCTNARFGYSLASLGDLDLDGFEDVAVGAPYEGDGAVYVFRGSKSGLIPEFSQRIEASDLMTARPLTTFGHALTGGLDMDSNTYPDLVVGAYESNKVVVLRARPVIDVSVQITSTPPEIDPDEEDRCDNSGRASKCFNLRVCFNFSAKPEDTFDEEITLDYRIEAETFLEGTLKSRVFFRGEKDANRHIVERSSTLYPQSQGRCKEEEHQVFIQKGNRDFLTPIRFQLTYALADNPPPVMQIGDDIPDINLFPVLNSKETTVVHAVEFKKNCGDDKLCQSNLQLDAKFLLMQEQKDGATIPDSYVLRLGEDLVATIDITVRNPGEDAHDASLNISLPQDMVYKGTDGEGQVSCIPDSSNKQNVLCSLGNPLIHGDEVSFRVRLDPGRLEPSSEHLELTLQLNTTSDEIDEDDNRLTMKVKVVVHTDVGLLVSSVPDVAYFSGSVIGESAVKDEEQIGPEVTHRYEVKNFGNVSISDFTLTVFWPFELANNREHGKHLLYLLEAPLIKGAEGQELRRCSIDDRYVNPIKVKLDNDLLLRNQLQDTESNGDGIVEEPEPDNSTKPLADVDTEASKRVKRDLAVSTASNRKTKTLDCDTQTAKCFNFTCRIGRLTPLDRSVTVYIRSRLWSSTFLEEFIDYNSIRVQSKGVLHVPAELNVEQPNYSNDVDNAYTTVLPAIEVKPQEPVPIWIIIVAVIAGIILLVVIIVLLWKCGFFQRKKADEAQRHKAKVEKKKHTHKYKKAYNSYD